MKYNPNIHHRRSIRLKGYDYSQTGSYYITICCQNRVCCFGKIENGKMLLNENGKIVQMVWNELPIHFPNAKLGEFVVMPNHIHGIVEIYDDDGRGANDDDGRGANDDDGRGANDDDGRGAINRAPTDTNHNNKKNGGFSGECNPMVHENLSRIVRWLKGRISFECRKTFPYFAWQRNYWENIIRNEKAYQYIANYIVNNPVKWENDSFYTD